MLVRTKEELQELKKQIPQELLVNPQFAQEWYYAVEYEFEDKAPIDINISAEDKRVEVVPQVKINRNISIPEGTLNAFEFQINQRGAMIITNSYGTMMDARAYYMKTGNSPTNSSSILGVHYFKKIIDSNGIELANGTYSKHNSLFRSGLGFEYDCKSQLAIQLLTEGWHKPRNWNVFNTPNLPEYTNDTVSVQMSIRNHDNPLLVEEISYGIDSHKNQANRKCYLSKLHTEYPERIRVDTGYQFAEISYGRTSLFESYPGEYEGKTVEDIIKDISLNGQQILEYKKNNARDEAQSRQYEILLEQVKNYNKRYNQELEQTSGMHI